MDFKARLRKAIAASAYSSWGGLKALSVDAGVHYNTLRVYVSDAHDIKKPRGGAVQRLAQALVVDPAWLETGQTMSNLPIEIIGEVSEGERWTPYEPGNTDSFTLGIEPNVSRAVRVRGRSMHPVYRDGELLIVTPVSDDLHGKDCVVRTADRGHYLKQVLKGSGPSLFTLRSFNRGKYPDLENQVILQAWVVTMVIRF